MQRAMELAMLGAGHVSPNPRVGCVIAHDGKIVGEGWHQKFGGAHAEVNAIHAVEDKSILGEAVLYVNLEPCAHYGKTPPCVDLIIQHRLKKVVIANKDPNPLVMGRGIEKLKAAGIAVELGILEKEGKFLNRRFFTFINQNRPYIILKWAQTSDGFIASENEDSKWISNLYSRQLVHKWRTEEDAVLVGTRTAAHDNPQLTVREWTGRNPTRLVIDRFLKLDKSLLLFDGTNPTRCYNLLKNEKYPNLVYVQLNEKDFVVQMLADCYQCGIQSIIVEGGAQTLKNFIEGGCWDEARVFTSMQPFGSGIKAPVMAGALSAQETIQGDDLRTYTRERANSTAGWDIDPIFF